jgi:hypothetical protein
MTWDIPEDLDHSSECLPNAGAGDGSSAGVHGHARTVGVLEALQHA